MKPFAVRVFAFLSMGGLLLPFAGCKESRKSLDSAESPSKAIDPCSLLLKTDIEKIQGSPVNDARSSAGPGGGLLMSQCSYTTAESSRSVNLSVTQADPDSPNKRSAGAYWEEIFGKYENEEEREKEKAEGRGNKEKKESLREQRNEREEEDGQPPKKISGVGDEAFWAGNRVGGSLYVFKKSRNVFLRISLGGVDNEQTKIEKAKKLAEKALGRL